MINLYSIGSSRLGFGHQYRINRLSIQAKLLGIPTKIINLDLGQKVQSSYDKSGKVAIIDFINPYIFYRYFSAEQHEKIYYLNDMGWSHLPDNCLSLPTQNIIEFKITRMNQQVTFDPSGDKAFIESNDFMSYYKSLRDCNRCENKDGVYIALGSNPRYIRHEDLIKIVQNLKTNGIQAITLLISSNYFKSNDLINMGVKLVNRLDFEHLDSHRFVLTAGGFLKQEVACLNKEMAVFPINKHQELLAMSFAHKHIVPIIRRKLDFNIEFRRPSYQKRIKPQNGAKYILELAHNREVPAITTQNIDTIVQLK